MFNMAQFLNLFTINYFKFQFNDHMKEENGSVKKMMTNAEKKDLMWNIIQPGDPYDIRKSMIAKLPGQRKYMGPHLELVCLLQAAEIERLCLFLEEYKVKLRESERLELDRHSYQVQIKELSEKLTDHHNFKLDNDKLKDYIRRQTIELQQLQKQQNNKDLSRKYENSLKQIQSLIQQKDDLKEINKKLANEINNLQQLNKINEQLKNKQLQTLGKQIERINQNQLQQEKKYREKSNRWEYQRKISENQIGSINKKYQDLLENFRELEGINQSLKKQLEKTKYEAAKCEQYRKTFKQYEDRFIKVAEEIDRLNDVLKDKSRLLNEQYLHSKQLSQKLRSKEQEISEQEQTITELQKSNSTLQKEQREALASLTSLQQNKIIIKSYEASLQQFSIEVERLNNLLFKKHAELEECKAKNNQYQIKLKNIQATERDIQQYKVKYGEIMKKLAEFESQNARLAREIDKLNYSSKKSLEEKQLIEIDNQNYQLQLQKLQASIDNFSSQLEKKKVGKKSEAEESHLTQFQKLNQIVSQYKQQTAQSQEKIDYYLREIKILQQKLRLKQAPSNFRSIYDSSQQFKADLSSEENKIEYMNDLKKRIKVLQFQLKKVQQSVPSLSAPSYQLSPSKDPQKIQSFRTPEEEIYKLKDLLLNKEIQNSRLAEINEQLREMVHDYKRQINQTSFPTGKKEGLTYAAFSPSTEKEYTKIEKEVIQPKQWQIQEEQQINVIQSSHPELRQEPYRRDTPRNIKQQKYKKERQQISQIQSKLKQKQEQIEQKQDKYREFKARLGMKQMGQQRMKQTSEESYRYNEPSQYETQNRQRYIQNLPDATLFKKTLQDLEQIKQPETLAINFKKKYIQLLQTYQQSTKNNHQYRNGINNLNEEKQLNESYINLLTDKIELLNNQISQLKKHVDPKLYLENQDSQLSKSYSLLLEKYHNATLENDTLRSKLKNINQEAPFTASDNGNEQIRRLYAENEELRNNCAKFSQYYNKILMVNDQLERLNKILFEKDREIKAKQTKITNYQIQQLNYESQISQLEVKLRDLTGNSKVSLPMSLENESDKLSREIARLQKRNGELERIIKGYELQDPNFAAIMEEKNQLQEMKVQISRLNKLLVNKKNDIDTLEEQNKFLARNVEEGKKPITTQDNRKIISAYEEKIVLLSQQIQRLNGLLKIKNQNFNTLKSQFDNYQVQTKKQLSTYAIEVGRLKQQISLSQGDVEKIRIKDSDNKSSSSGVRNLTEYERRIWQLSNEIDRLNKILISNKQKIDEIDGKQMKYRSEIERLNNSLRLKVEQSMMVENKEKTHLQQKRMLHLQIQDKVRDYQKLIKRNQIIQQQNTKLKQYLNQNDVKIRGLQNERLQKMITILKSENEDNGEHTIGQLIEKNRFLIAQIERLSQILSKQSEELSGLRLNLADEITLQKRIKEDLGLFVILFAEIESLRNRLKDQEKEMEQVRRTSIISRKV